MIHAQRLPTLDAARVRLRWLEASDVPALFEIYSDPEVMRFWSGPPHAGPDDARRLIEEIHRCFERRDLFEWGVARVDDDRVIGTCTLARIDPVHRRAELGFALRRDHWGRGLMREALDRLLDFAFGDLGLHRLEADVDPRNAASIRLLDRLGFRREGLLRERWHVGGEVQDALFMGLLRHERPARPGRRR